MSQNSLPKSAPQLLDEIDEIGNQNGSSNNSEITIDLIREILRWDKSNKQLTQFERKLMNGLESGETILTDRNLIFAKMCLIKATKFGFNLENTASA